MAPTDQDISRNADRCGPRPFATPPWRGFWQVSAIGLAAWTALHLALFGHIAPGYWLVGLSLSLAALAVLARQMPAHYPHAAFGACNTVTLLRGSLMLVLVTPLVAGAAPGWGVFAVAALAAGLDGVDGWLARRSGLASGFGARFDMETDSALALVLALHALADGLAWPLALVLGGSRYLFLAGMALAPWLRQPLPERFGRKVVCALQIAVLVALQAPPLAGAKGAGLLAATAAALAVLASFGRDILWLRRQRG